MPLSQAIVLHLHRYEGEFELGHHLVAMWRNAEIPRIVCKAAGRSNHSFHLKKMIITMNRAHYYSRKGAV